MDDLRKEQLNTFIENAGKSNEPVLYNAFTGKPVRQGDELNINVVSVVNWGVGIISFCLFAWWLVCFI